MSHDAEVTRSKEAPILTPAAATMPSVPDDSLRPKSWLDFRHPEWVNNSHMWAFAQAHYTADLLNADHISNFLIRRSTGESEAAFNERAKLADYTPHFGAVIDSLAGMLFQVESRANRQFGNESQEGLGKIDDPDTVIGRLWRNVDGSGTDYLTFWKIFSIEMLVNHLTWCVVDTDESGERAMLRTWPALSVPNWRWENGRLVEVLLEENRDVRSSIQDDPSTKPSWVLYTLTGWSRWEKDVEGNATQVDEGEYTYVDSNGNKILPVFPIKLPMKRNVGYILSRKANIIFNKESERDHLLRVANFPYINLIASDTQYESITGKMKDGWRALQVDPTYKGKAHHFIQPSSESAKIASEVLERKVEEFWITAFREYSDAAQERTTATEIRQDVSAGVGAFLQMMKAGVDEAENNALLRIAQIEFPNAKQRWFINTVERSEDFVPLDIQQEIDRMRKRYFGETGMVPVGRAGKIAAVKKIAEWDGVAIDDVEVEAAIDIHLLKENMEPFRELPIPPQVKAEWTIKLMLANGLIDPEAEVEMEDGEKMQLVDVVREQAVAIAESLDMARNALAQPPTDGGGSGPPFGGNSKDDDDDK